jgi:hypothetical protein
LCVDLSTSKKGSSYLLGINKMVSFNISLVVCNSGLSTLAKNTSYILRPLLYNIYYGEL